MGEAEVNILKRFGRWVWSVWDLLWFGYAASWLVVYAWLGAPTGAWAIMSGIAGFWLAWVLWKRLMQPSQDRLVDSYRNLCDVYEESIKSLRDSLEAEREVNQAWAAAVALSEAEGAGVDDWLGLIDALPESIRRGTLEEMTSDQVDWINLSTDNWYIDPETRTLTNESTDNNTETATV